MTGADKPFLWNGQWRPRGNRELLFDEIDAGDHLGDGMFDLEPRVHFKKIEGAAAIDELDRARAAIVARPGDARRSEEHTSELQSLMRISYAVFCLKKKNKQVIERQR